MTREQRDACTSAAIRGRAVLHLSFFILHCASAMCIVHHVHCQCGASNERRNPLSSSDARRRNPAAAPRRRISRASVRSRRVPLMPSGWPSAIAPPFTLTLSRGSPSSCSTARYCAANASLISNRSMSDERQAGALEQLARGRRRPHPHQASARRPSSPTLQAAQAAPAEPVDGRPRGEHQRGAAVDDAAGVAGGDAPVLRERRRQLREPLERGVWPHVVVARERLDALARLHVDGHDLLGETSCVPRGGRELLAATARTRPAPAARCRTSPRSSRR